MIRKWYWRVMVALTADRGEGPVPYIIMVAIMALAAVAIATGVSGVATRWLTQLQNTR